VSLSEGLHHFFGGVRAIGITLSADDLVLGGKTQFSGKVVFGLGTAGVNIFVLSSLSVTEKGQDQSFVFKEFTFLFGLQFANKGFTAFIHVHGSDESKKTIGTCGRLSRPLVTP